METMTISLTPYAFGSPLITWAGLATLAGLLIGGALFARAAAPLGASRRDACAITLAASLGGIAGARLLRRSTPTRRSKRSIFGTAASRYGGAVLGGLAAGALAGG